MRLEIEIKVAHERTRGAYGALRLHRELNQKFEASRPNQVWLTDITHVPTGEGWLYLAAIKDLFTCEIVGYAMSDRMTTH